MLTVPVLRPEVAREYEQYQAAVDEYNRRRMEEMRKAAPGTPVCMAYAHAAPRCKHVRADGTRCAAPALRGRQICYAHTRMAATRQAGLKLPALEDAAGISLAAMQVVQQMLDGKLPRRKAATALYGIQIAASTLNHQPFAAPPTSVVTEAEGLPPEEELFATEPAKDDSTGSEASVIANPKEIAAEQAMAPGEAASAEESSQNAGGIVPTEHSEKPDVAEEERARKRWDAWAAEITAIANGSAVPKPPQNAGEGDPGAQGVG